MSDLGEVEVSTGCRLNHTILRISLVSPAVRRMGSVPSRDNVV